MYYKNSTKPWREEIDESYFKVHKLYVKYSITKQRVLVKKTIRVFKWYHKNTQPK